MPICNDKLHVGHVVGNGEVKPEQTKIEAVKDFPLPRSKKQVRTFLALIGYYCKFIYAAIAAPLSVVN